MYYFMLSSTLCLITFVCFSTELSREEEAHGYVVPCRPAARQCYDSFGFKAGSWTILLPTGWWKGPHEPFLVSFSTVQGSTLQWLQQELCWRWRDRWVVYVIGFPSQRAEGELGQKEERWWAISGWRWAGTWAMPWVGDQAARTTSRGAGTDTCSLKWEIRRWTA